MNFAMPQPHFNWTATDKNYELTQFKNACKLWFSGPLSKLSVQEKTSYTLLWLGEEGQEHHSHWTPPIKDECPLEHIWKNLEIRTGSSISKLVFRHNLHQTCQAKDEDIEHFILRCRRIVTRCGYKEPEEQLLDALVSGIHSQTARE